MTSQPFTVKRNRWNNNSVRPRKIIRPAKKKAEYSNTKMPWKNGLRKLNFPVTGKILQQKALQLHKKLKNNNEIFTASGG